MERYTNYLGGLGDGASILSMLDDLADLFEQGAADGTPVRLPRAIERAAGEDTGSEGTS
jgi:hypothetical protein